MEIQLTLQQQHALDSMKQGPAKFIDPRTRAAYVLIRESDYEAVRELLKEEQERQLIHTVALRNAAGRMDEAP